VLGKWIDRWSRRADEAALGLGQIVASVPGSGVTAEQVAAHAREAREQYLAGLSEVDGTTETGSDLSTGKAS
jgi:hypothetical protein